MAPEVAHLHLGQRVVGCGQVVAADPGDHGDGRDGQRQQGQGQGGPEDAPVARQLTLALARRPPAVVLPNFRGRRPREAR
jgi:hypothetical protein